MICKNCGNQLAEGAGFCNLCGSKVEAESKAFCKNCGAEMAPGMRFCKKCGAPVDGRSIVDVPSEPLPQKNNTATIIIVVLILTIALLGSAIAGFLLLNGGDDSSSKTKPTKTEQTIKTQTPKKTEKPDRTEKPERTEELVESEAPHITPNPSPSPSADPGSSSEYLFPSDSRYIYASDLEGKTQQEVAFIRNEIYARHGYVFQTEPYKSYFEAKSWYYPNPSFNESQFSSIEKANKDFIVEFEKSKGWR